MVTVQWRRGGGHIFNVEKVNGRVRDYEAQSREATDFDGDYGLRTGIRSGDVQFARVDGLVPTDDVFEFVQEGSKEWRKLASAKRKAASA